MGREIALFQALTIFKSIHKVTKLANMSLSQQASKTDSLS